MSLLSLRDVRVNLVVDGSAKLTTAWRMSLTQNEQAVWSALETAHSTAVPLSFGDLARMAGLSMNATKMALYKLQQHGLIMGMPD